MKGAREKINKVAMVELKIRFDKVDRMPYGHLFNYWVSTGHKQKGVIVRYSNCAKLPAEIHISIEKLHKYIEVGEFSLLILFGKFSFCVDSSFLWNLAHIHHNQLNPHSKTVCIKVIIADDKLRLRSPTGCTYCDGPLNHFSETGIAYMAKRSDHRNGD